MHEILTPIRVMPGGPEGPGGPALPGAPELPRVPFTRKKHISYLHDNNSQGLNNVTLHIYCKRICKIILDI